MYSQQLIQIQTRLAPRFPHHPAPARTQQSAAITAMVSQYHNPQWIGLEDDICYHSAQEYLKRYYTIQEYGTKIKLLGEYYRYHGEVPMMFGEGVARIMESHLEDKRLLEYDTVTRQMGAAEGGRTNRLGGGERLVKDVELSYDDFEARRDGGKAKTQQAGRQIGGRAQLDKNQDKNGRGLTRVQSINTKGTFLVFKPRGQPNLTKKQKQDAQKKSKQMPKYKKPNSAKNMKKSYNSSKPQTNSKQKILSKVTSANNSVASHQGLSRSKSKTQLQLISAKRFDTNRVKEINEKVKTNRTSTASEKGQMVKSCSKNEILCEKRDYSNNLSRNASKVDLNKDKKTTISNNPNRQSQKVVNIELLAREPSISNQQNQAAPKSSTVSRKASTSNLEPKKMFNRAIELKKKKL